VTVLFGSIALNLVAFLLVLPLNFGHLLAVPGGIPLRLTIGLGFGFILLPLKPSHSLIILFIKPAEAFLRLVSAIPASVVVRIGTIGTPRRLIISTSAKSIRIVGRSTAIRAAAVRNPTVRVIRGSAVRVVGQVTGGTIGSAGD